MNDDRKRKFDAVFAPSTKSMPPVKLTKMKAGSRTWSDLSVSISGLHAVALKHTYQAPDGTKESMVTTHAHNDFKTGVHNAGGDLELRKHNISTSTPDHGASSLGRLVTDMGGHKGATDALRVLKGNHTKWFLSGKTDARRKASVEMAAEIGISEYARGGTHALINAASSLYLLKHQEITSSEFVDHNVGYKGAGKGGAGRLRAISGMSEALDLTRLQKVFKSHAVKKDKWKADKTSKGFQKWAQHKVNRWKAREG
jgi:hypothetical protein